MKERWYQNPSALTRKINVPFAFQTELSGINEQEFHDVVWYERTIEVPKKWGSKQIILHFGAVDYRAKVFVNGQLAGEHGGGHTSFSFDITHALNDRQASIVVRAEDPSRDETIPRGKQFWKEEIESIWYTNTTGIWQPVWLEPVSDASALHGYCYTQLTDVEQEINGILTYDRKPKCDLKIIREINLQWHEEVKKLKGEDES